MKNNYTTPKICFIEFSIEDTVTCSGNGGKPGGGVIVTPEDEF